MGRFWPFGLVRSMGWFESSTFEEKTIAKQEKNKKMKE
jgi:hypothetical protein